MKIEELRQELRETVTVARHREYQEWTEPAEEDIITDDDVEIIGGELFVVNKVKLERVIKHLEGIPDRLEQSLSETIEDLMASKGIVKNSDVYLRANIDRKLFSSIMINDRIPKKATLFALCFGLKLTRGEAGKLLATAGFLFSKSLRFDMYIEELLIRKIYSITDINEILRDARLPELGSINMLDK